MEGTLTTQLSGFTKIGVHSVQTMLYLQALGNGFQTAFCPNWLVSLQINWIKVISRTTSEVAILARLQDLYQSFLSTTPLKTQTERKRTCDSLIYIYMPEMGQLYIIFAINNERNYILMLKHPNSL